MIRRAEQDQRHLEEVETQWAVGRELLALNYNINRGKGQAAKKGSDWIKLSFDKKNKKKETPRLTPDEVEKRFGKLTDKIKW